MEIKSVWGNPLKENSRSTNKTKLIQVHLRSHSSWDIVELAEISKWSWWEEGLGHGFVVDWVSLIANALERLSSSFYSLESYSFQWYF